MRGRPLDGYDVPGMNILRWEDIPLEQLTPLLTRQAIHGTNLTIGLFHLDKGCDLPEHKHIHEQICVLLEGRLRFRSQDREVILEAGSMLHFAPNEPHAVTALEDSIAMDVFGPVRDDWRSGDDAYIRESPK